MRVLRSKARSAGWGWRSATPDTIALPAPPRRQTRFASQSAFVDPPHKGEGKRREPIPHGIALYVTAFALLFSATFVSASELPPGFVHLADIDPSIRQDIRYAGPENFMRRPITGYDRPACILTKQAADALSTVQAKLKAASKTLVVFDCYRPRRAVRDMVEWTQVGNGRDAQWYPGVDRRDLIAKGYIGQRSGHSRGSTVDLAIALLDPAGVAPDPACGARDAKTLDFGSGFDCFDPASETASRTVTPEARRNRDELVRLMREAGFKNYRREWWHFSLIGEPFGQAFDFPVTAK